MDVFYYYLPQQQHTLPQILQTDVTTVVTRSTIDVTTQVIALIMQHMVLYYMCLILSVVGINPFSIFLVFVLEPVRSRTEVKCHRFVFTELLDS